MYKVYCEWLEAEKQLCIACATRVLNWVDNECEKIKKEMAGEG